MSDTGLTNDDQQQTTDTWKPHPAWDSTLEMFPDGPQREALLHQIRETDTNSQKAIESARANAAPEEWRGLIEAANEAGLTPEELVESYNQMDTMREQIAADPDAWLASINSEIDQAVANGQLTRKAGAAAKRDAASAANDAGADDTVNLDTPEQQQLAEMRQQIEAQNQRWQQEEQRREQEEQERQEQEQQQQTETVVNQFIETFEGTFNADEQLRQVEPQTRYIVANHAINLMTANPELTEQQATDEAINQFRTHFGLGGGPRQQAPGVPIGGGTNATVTTPQAGAGNMRGIDKAREQAMLEAAAEMQRAGIQ